jgi:hypothetical protein
MKRKTKVKLLVPPATAANNKKLKKLKPKKPDPLEPNLKPFDNARARPAEPAYVPAGRATPGRRETR